MNITNPLPSFNDRDRGQVGIGTLIVFIAMVLVAAIAAGVLINTAGFLQEKSTETGQSASDQVTNTIRPVSVVGLDSTGNNDIETISITARRSPGAKTIDLTALTIQITGEQGEALATQGSGFTIQEISADLSGGSKEVLASDKERSKIQINLAAVYGELTPGEDATLTIVAPSGAKTTIVVTVPDPIGNNAVEL